MIDNLITAAKQGKSVYITDVRREFEQAPDPWTITCDLILPDGKRTKRFVVTLPRLDTCGPDEVELAQRFALAEIYNHLTTLGGTRLVCYLDGSHHGLSELANSVVEALQVSVPSARRDKYGRVINVLDRMITALHADEEGPEKPVSFLIEVRTDGGVPSAPAAVEFRQPKSSTLADVTRGLDDRVVCGLDIGGTDIKAALSLHGRLNSLVEYDWNPATYADVEQVIDPIVAIARAMQARASVELASGIDATTRARLIALLDDAADHPSSCEPMLQAATEVESTLGSEMIRFDAVGLCFPDVVVRNKIVGGEVPKTQAMRLNTERDFDTQFRKLTDLDLQLEGLCREPGTVMNTNDGPMASFTAAVELAASENASSVDNGIFAFALGTDLGTGLVLADGSIPEIPLEVYNLVVDLGSNGARAFPAADLRSLANTNTGIQGTLQKIASQAGAFRIADMILGAERPELLREIEKKGFIRTRGSGPDTERFVPESPKDQRKPYLAYLMDLAAQEETVAQVFRFIGDAMAVVSRETEHILNTRLTDRFLFGRFAKVARCFELMQEGASGREPTLRLVAADSEIAYTPLMAELAAHPEYTVAQFGQAIGAIYFGNLALTRREVR
jgi:hypothetical protein